MASASGTNLAGLGNLTARFEYGQDDEQENITWMEAAGDSYADGGDGAGLDANDFSTANFVLNRLAVGRSVDDSGDPIGGLARGMTLALRDAVDNSPGEEAEAVYARTLEMLPGSIIDIGSPTNLVPLYYLHAAGDSDPNANPRQFFPGDAQLDGMVTGTDFMLWQAHYPMSANATLSDGDFNGDRQITGADFVIWQAWYPSYSPDQGGDWADPELVDFDGDGEISPEEAARVFGTD